MKFWCENCKHLLPLENNERTPNFREWWRKNRLQYKLMHQNGHCNSIAKTTAITKYKGK